MLLIQVKIHSRGDSFIINNCLWAISDSTEFHFLSCLQTYLKEDSTGKILKYQAEPDKPNLRYYPVDSEIKHFLWKFSNFFVSFSLRSWTSRPYKSRGISWQNQQNDMCAHLCQQDTTKNSHISNRFKMTEPSIFWAPLCRIRYMYVFSFLFRNLILNRTEKKNTKEKQFMSYNFNEQISLMTTRGIE